MKYTIIFITVLLALFCRSFLVSVYKVPSHKMAPTILSGEYLFASKMSFGVKMPWSDEVFLSKRPARGDLVVFNKDSKVFIKRIIGANLDEIQYVDGEFSVNSTKCTYQFIEKTADPQYSFFDEQCPDSSRGIYRSNDVVKFPRVDKLKLDNTHVFVANDFRDAEGESDSAEVISNDQIIGKPLFVWMSYSSTQDFISESLGLRFNRILTKLK